MNAETPSSPAPKAAVRPVCFMVMPFRRKTVTGAREGAPSEVDFDRLRLADNQDSPSFEERKYLKRAIEAYEQGMRLDLNEYYCSCNLPALIRARGKQGDDELARNVDTLVVAACRRAEELGTGDEWLRDTLLGAAFRSGDVATVEELAEELDAGWRTHSTLSDARDWIELAPEESRAELRDLLHEMEEAFKSEAPERGDG